MLESAREACARRLPFYSCHHRDTREHSRVKKAHDEREWRQSRKWIMWHASITETRWEQRDWQIQFLSTTTMKLKSKKRDNHGCDCKAQVIHGKVYAFVGTWNMQQKPTRKEGKTATCKATASGTDSCKENEGSEWQQQEWMKHEDGKTALPTWASRRQKLVRSGVASMSVRCLNEWGIRPWRAWRGPRSYTIYMKWIIP